MRCPNCGYIIDEPRGRDQSRLLHRSIRAYAQSTGYDFDWAKTELKYNYGLWEAVPMDLTEWEPPEWSGAFFEMYPDSPHHIIVFMKSEAALTKGEEAGFIDFVVNRCYQVGADMKWYEEYQEAKLADESKGTEKEDRLPAGEGGGVAGVQPVGSS